MVLPRWLPKRDVRVESLSCLYTRLYSALQDFCNDTVTDARHFGYCTCQITSYFYYIIVSFHQSLKKSHYVYVYTRRDQLQVNLAVTPWSRSKKTYPQLHRLTKKNDWISSLVATSDTSQLTAGFYITTKSNIRLQPVRIALEICPREKYRRRLRFRRPGRTGRTIVAGHQPVQGESVGLYVNVPRAVVWIPRVIEGAQLRLVRGHRRQQVGAEGLLGQLSYAVHPPHVVVLVVEEAVPPLAHQWTVPQCVQVQIREYHL